MAEKIIYGRSVQKHDIESNWQLATNFTPKQGEIIVYDIDDNYDYERIKIGDGVQNVNDLPFYAGSWNDLTDKPFGLQENTITIVDEQSISNNSIAMSAADISNGFESPGKYKFIINNEQSYIFEKSVSGILSGGYLIGDGLKSFPIVVPGGGSSLSGVLYRTIAFKDLTVNTIRVEYILEQLQTLDETFIPDTIARVSDVDEVKSLIGDTSVSEQIDNAIAEIPAEIFIATYGATTISELLEAYKAGKTMFCEYKDADIYAVLSQAVYESDTECGFTFTDSIGRTVVGLTLIYGESWTMQSIELADKEYVDEQLEASNIIYVGPTQPTDPNIKVWINTAEEGTGIVPVLPRIATVSLPVANWTGNSAPYSQVVSINTVTSATKIDLQPTVAQIVDLQNQDIALMAENSADTVTIYSFGGKPSSDMTMQVLLQEVAFV